MVEAAIELMAEKGLRKFRFEELAEKVDYNRATIYRYFDSKQELVREVMMALMHQITNDIIEHTAGNEKMTALTFTDSMYKIIIKLRTEPRYAIIMDAENITSFAELTHQYFSGITKQMLEKHLNNDSGVGTLKEGITIDYAVHWLIHQIISYGFFGLKGETEQEQKEYLHRMVTPIII